MTITRHEEYAKEITVRAANVHPDNLDEYEFELNWSVDMENNVHLEVVMKEEWNGKEVETQNFRFLQSQVQMVYISGGEKAPMTKEEAQALLKDLTERLENWPAQEQQQLL